MAPSGQQQIFSDAHPILWISPRARFRESRKNYDVTFKSPKSLYGQSSTIQVFDIFEIKRQAVNFLRNMALFQIRAKATLHHPQRSRQKISWNQINHFFFVKLHFWQVLNFFPVQKLIFGHFWNCKKWILVRKYS